MEFLALVIAIVAFIMARKARLLSKELNARLAQLEGAAQGTIGATSAPSPVAETPVAPPIAPEPIPVATEPELQAAETTQATTENADTPSAVPQQDTSAAARPGLEERLGTRWVVWIGGLTLALGGFFLVRYSIEAGLLGPGVRVLLGAAFALALLAAGEWTRRRESISAIAPLPIANIPAILTAAGTAVAFATVYAAYALYDFLNPPIAFALLGAVALGTLAAALLHGPALAGLGVIGAFVTPVLVSSNEPSYSALYVYITIVTTAAFALARARLWRWLALATIAFSLLWLLIGIDGLATLGPVAFDALANFALAALLVVAGFMFGPSAEPGRVDPVSSLSIAASVFGATALVLSAGHATPSLMLFGVLIAATLVVAWRAESATAAVGTAAVFVFVVFAAWAVRGNPDFAVVPGGAMIGIGPEPYEASVSLHLTVAAIFAAAFGGASFLAQGRSVSALVPVIWSASGVFVPLALLVALYARIAHLDRSIPFAIVGIALAAAFAVATELLSKRDARPGQAISIALFATGTLAALALAFTFALEKGWLTIALALMSLGTAWISMKRPIPFLRWLAAILAAIVVLRIGYEPRIAGNDVGNTPIFNWLLLGYGIPALSFWGGAHLMRRRGDDAPLRMVESAAILFTALLAFMEIRHFVNSGDVYRRTSDFTETALQVCVALAMALGLERLRVRSGSIVHNIAAVLLTVAAALATVFGLFVFANPMLWRIDVGSGIINLLLLGYALPAVLALLLSYAVAGRRAVFYGNTIAAGALLLALAYVTTMVRHAFHGPILNSWTMSDAEQYAYSVAWLVFGIILLGAGLLMPSQRARLASAVIIGITILKVFLIDMANLTGAYRAFSFIGLGLVLVAIGWLYQRILFRRPRAVPASPSAGS